MPPALGQTGSGNPKAPQGLPVSPSIHVDRRIELKALAAVPSLLLALGFPGIALSDTPAQLIGKDLGQSREQLASAMRGRSYVVEVDRHGKIVQVLGTGAGSDIAEAQHLVDNRPQPAPAPGPGPVSAATVVVSAATAPAPDTAPVPQAGLEASFKGQAAIDYLGPDLPAIAAANGMPPDKLEELFLNDDTVRIDRDNRIFYAGNTAE